MLTELLKYRDIDRKVHRVGVDSQEEEDISLYPKKTEWVGTEEHIVDGFELWGMLEG